MSAGLYRDSGKILHVVPSFGLGGMERVICTIVDGTTSHYNHTILSLSGNIAAKVWIKSISPHYIPFVKPPTRTKFFLSLYRQLQIVRPQILMTYNWGATDAIWLGCLAGIRNIIHSEHGFNIDEVQITNKKRDFIRSILYSLTSTIVVVSQDLQTRMKHHYGLQGRKVVLIPNGIDTQYYTPNERERMHTREALGFQDQDVVVGFVGRLDPVKNLDFLLQVFAASAKEHKQFKLLIVGDGPERLRLEDLCRRYHIQSHVLFTGQKENILTYLRAIDVFLITSFREQMPMTVLEAMAVGIPVVASSVGEIPYVVDNEVNGFVHSLDEGVKVFGFSLRLLLAPTQRKAFGMAARRKVVKIFPQLSMISRYQSLLIAGKI